MAVDFTDDLWLLLSPWGKHLEDVRYADAIALAWVTLWNYTLDQTSATVGQIQTVCKGLFEIPTNELVDLLLKRRAVFFPDDHRLIDLYRVEWCYGEFRIFVVFVEPNR